MLIAINHCPRKYTQLCASILFLVFGAKLLWEVWEQQHQHQDSLKPGQNTTGTTQHTGPENPDILKEMEEVQRELDQALLNGPMPKRWEEEPDDVESGMGGGRSAGGATPTGMRKTNTSGSTSHLATTAAGGPPGAGSGGPTQTSTTGTNNNGPPGLSKSKSSHVHTPPGSSWSKMLERWHWRITTSLMTVFKPVFVQTFMMTLLAEWGDRSQIATIALAASKVTRWLLFECV